MTSVIVLAYDGTFDAVQAIEALVRGYDVPVVTMTADVGQSRDVHATRDAALAAGALRAHVFDAVDDFVRLCVLPALQAGTAGVTAVTDGASLAYPVIAARLVDAAHVEATRTVAHGGGEALSAAIRALDASLQVLTLGSARTAPRPHAAATDGAARHLLQRPVADPARARGVPARLDIEFDEAVPVAINGVTLGLAELVESLSLIGGEHGLGHADSSQAPGVLVLDAAYRALEDRSGVVRLELLDGQQRVLAATPRSAELVNHA